MTMNRIIRAVRAEEAMAVGLRVHKHLFRNLKELGFWQSGSCVEGNEEHFFFTYKYDDGITLDVTLFDRVVMGINIMMM